MKYVFAAPSWERFGRLLAIDDVRTMHDAFAAFGAKKYQSLVEHISLDSFVKMPDVLVIGK
jgi:hypothetical protein